MDVLHDDCRFWPERIERTGTEHSVGFSRRSAGRGYQAHRAALPTFNVDGDWNDNLRSLTQYSWAGLVVYRNGEINMALGKHQRTTAGRFRKERADSLAKNLREEYPEFNKVHGSTKLGTLKEELGADSLNEVREALRELPDKR